MPLNYILIKCKGGYKVNGKMNQLVYMDDIKILAKNKKN